MTITEAVVAVLVVGICIGLPVFGLTLRFAFKPMLEAWRSVMPQPVRQGQPDELEGLKLRVAALEAISEHRFDAHTATRSAAAIVTVERGHV